MKFAHIEGFELTAIIVKGRVVESGELACNRCDVGHNRRVLAVVQDVLGVVEDRRNDEEEVEDQGFSVG